MSQDDIITGLLAASSTKYRNGPERSDRVTWLELSTEDATLGMIGSRQPTKSTGDGTDMEQVFLSSVRGAVQSLQGLVVRIERQLGEKRSVLRPLCRTYGNYERSLLCRATKLQTAHIPAAAAGIVQYSAPSSLLTPQPALVCPRRSRQLAKRLTAQLQQEATRLPEMERLMLSRARLPASKVPLLVFVKNQKVGGTTLEGILRFAAWRRGRYAPEPPGAGVEFNEKAVLALQEQQLQNPRHRIVDILCNHVQRGYLERLPLVQERERVDFITMVRDPYSHLRSMWDHGQRAKAKGNRAFCNQYDSFREALQNCNMMWNSQLKYIAPVPTNMSIAGMDAILQQYRLVGITERFDDFLLLLISMEWEVLPMLSMIDILYFVSNAAPPSKDNIENAVVDNVTGRAGWEEEEENRLIRIYAAGDILLYEAARRRLDAQLERFNMVHNLSDAQGSFQILQQTMRNICRKQPMTLLRKDRFGGQVGKHAHCIQAFYTQCLLGRST
eukprot:scaffold2974_cov404-Prasinococcus_capsulatus_cf.AAC.2